MILWTVNIRRRYPEHRPFGRLLPNCPLMKEKDKLASREDFRG